MPVSRDPRPSRRSQAERRAETRRALIDAGRALFTEQGFRDVTTSAIVERAAVTRGALYYHFPEGKDALFEAVFEAVEAEIDAAVLAAAQTTLQNTGDITEAFMAGTDRFLQESARPEIQRLLFTDGPAALGWDRWYDLDARHGMAQITLGFEELIAAGVIARQPVEPLSHIWYGATLGAARSIATADDPERALQDASDCLRQLLGGLRRAATTEPAGARPDDVR